MSVDGSEGTEPVESQPNPEGNGAEREQSEPEQQQRPKPTETVEFWKQKAREQEKRAKDNAAAAQQLAEIKDAQKSEMEKAMDRVAAAEAAASGVPEQVANQLRAHLVSLHNIDQDDADLFLTGRDPETLLKQVARLTAQQGKRGNFVAREGNNGKAKPTDERETVRALFGGN